MQSNGIWKRKFLAITFRSIAYWAEVNLTVFRIQHLDQPSHLPKALADDLQLRYGWSKRKSALHFSSKLLGMAGKGSEHSVSVPGSEDLIQLDHTSRDSPFEWQHAFKRVFWQGGSSFDAGFTASTFQVAQVLLNLPYSFAQMGMGSGIAYQLLYGLMGCWTSYLMTSLYLTYRNTREVGSRDPKNHTIQWYEVLDGLLGPWWKVASLFFNVAYIFFGATVQLIACASTVYYLNDSLDKRTWTLVFGPCMLRTILIPTAYNYRVWAFLGIVMTTFVAWYLTIAAAIHGKDPGVRHSAPTGYVDYFTGATNMLFTFGGHALTIEFVEAMRRPRRFKVVYMYSVLYVLTLTIPSAAAVYWAFGDKMLHNTNAFAVFPKSKFRDASIVLMVIHQFIEFGMLVLPLYLICEKLFGIHHSKRYILRTLARMPILLSIWVTALMVPFLGPIDSVIGSLFTSFSVYVIPCMAHMAAHRTASARKAAIEQPPCWVRNWVGVYCINLGIVIWVLVVGVGLGGWSSIVNVLKQVHTFGLFAKCYQCPHEA